MSGSCEGHFSQLLFYGILRKMFISSKNNDIRKKIKRIKTRDRARREEGLFFAEGRRLLSETPRELLSQVFVSEDFAYGDTEADDRLNALLKDFGETTTVSSAVFSEISDTRHSQGIAALVKCPVYPMSDLMKDVPLILVLENVQDPGNLGTMIRTALGAGATGIVLTDGCVDLFSPKVVRATMGAIYRLPYYRVRDVVSLHDDMRDEVRFFAASLHGEKRYDSCDYTAGTAFLIGNEGNGLTDEAIAVCDEEMQIPMENGLESLNAAMAAGILMYEAHRQRQ